MDDSLRRKNWRIRNLRCHRRSPRKRRLIHSCASLSHRWSNTRALRTPSTHWRCYARSRTLFTGLSRTEEWPEYVVVRGFVAGCIIKYLLYHLVIWSVLACQRSSFWPWPQWLDVYGISCYQPSQLDTKIKPKCFVISVPFPAVSLYHAQYPSTWGQYVVFCLCPCYQIHTQELPWSRQLQHNSQWRYVWI